MDSRLPFDLKKSELASQSNRSIETSASSLNIKPATSILSVEDSLKGNFLKEKGYETIKSIVNEENVKVITANCAETGGIVTIKIMSKTGDSGFCRKKGFYQEIEMTRHLNHPNLIQYYRSIETTNRFYIVMECAQGSLSDLIQKEKYLTEIKARHIYRQLASVLSYCNSRGAIHHDIRSETILFAADDVIKISLFGYSYRSMLNHCIVVDTDCESNSLTEPDYADIYGSGIVLFEMVYGKLPKGYDKVSLRHSLRYAEFPKEPVVTSMLKTLISRLIVSHSDSRMSWNNIIDNEWMLQEDMPKIVDD